MEAEVWEYHAWQNLYKECLDAAFDRVMFDDYRQALNERAMLEDGLAQQAQWQLDWEYQEGAEQTSQKFELLKFMIEWQQCHLVTCEVLANDSADWFEFCQDEIREAHYNSNEGAMDIYSSLIVEDCTSTEEDWAFFHNGEEPVTRFEDDDLPF
jgi:hypothetical protein